MPSDDLVLGVAVGVIAAGILGFVFGRVRLAQKSVQSFFAPRKPSLEPDQSPAQVCFGCLAAVLTLLVFVGLLMLVTLYALGYLE